MKTQLIVNNSYSIIVSNEAYISKDDLMFTHRGIERAQYSGYSFTKENEFCLKIIAGIYDLPFIDYNEFECQLDIKREQHCVFTGIYQDSNIWQFSYTDNEGMNRHSGLYLSESSAQKGLHDWQTSNENMFTLNDLRKAFLLGQQSMSDESISLDVEAHIKTFISPRIYDVEIEMLLQTRHGTKWYDLPEQKQGNEIDGIYRFIPKLTNHSIKILKIL